MTGEDFLLRGGGFFFNTMWFCSWFYRRRAGRIGVMEGGCSRRRRGVTHFTGTVKRPTHVTVLRFLTSRRYYFFNSVRRRLPVTGTAISRRLGRLGRTKLVRKRVRTPGIECYVGGRG